MLSEFLTTRLCPACDSDNINHVLFKKNLNENALNQLSFSSRKIPEFMNYTLICCPTCDLLYAPNVPNQTYLQSAYQSTKYDSSEEAYFAAETYSDWLKIVLPTLPDRAAALEIGTGNGAFLTHLNTMGFQHIIGIEPSLQAASSALPQVRKNIQIGMFDAKNYEENYFSLIAIFQTIEHMHQPLQFFENAFRLLKPKGALIIVSHNYRHWLMRLLGKKSPIIDIEHLQLFSPASLNFSLKKAGFQAIQSHPLYNTYPLHYWMKLLPISLRIKNVFLSSLKNGWGKKIGKLNIKLNVGNLVTLAYKT